MALIFGKIRTLVLSNIHSLLDKAIDLNSVEAVKQYIRDLEEAIEQTESTAAVAQGDMRTASDNVKMTIAKMEELQENINLLLGDGDDSNDHFAEPLVEKLMGFETILSTQREDELTGQTTLASLNEVVSKLRSKHVQMISQISRLEVLERSAKSKSNAAEAIKHATMMSGDAPSVDNISDRIKRQSNIADASLSRAMGTFNSQSADPVHDAKVAARLAAMKAKVKQNN